MACIEPSSDKMQSQVYLIYSAYLQQVRTVPTVPHEARVGPAKRTVGLNCHFLFSS